MFGSVSYLKNYYLACVNPSLWEDLTSQLNIDVEKLIRDNKEKIMKMLVKSKHEKVCFISNFVRFTPVQQSTRCCHSEKYIRCNLTVLYLNLSDLNAN